jgi:hypothetical protein
MSETPHVRLPSASRTSRHPHSPTNDREAFPTPVTYCGARATTVDLDRRDVTTQVAKESDWIKRVCPSCLVAVGVRTR